MIPRALTWTALVASAFIIASFGFFAYDQASGASKHQQALIQAGAHEDPSAAPVQAGSGEPRHAIDVVALRMTDPFRGLTSADSEWARRILQTLIGLLIYGVGIGFLARWSRGLSAPARSYPY